MNAHYSSTYKLILLKKYFFSIVRRVNEISLNLLLWPLVTYMYMYVHECIQLYMKDFHIQVRLVSVHM